MNFERRRLPGAGTDALVRSRRLRRRFSVEGEATSAVTARRDGVVLRRRRVGRSTTTRR